MAQEKDISFRQEDPSWIFELFFVMNFEFNFGKPEIVDANLPTVLDFRCDKVNRNMTIMLFVLSWRATTRHLLCLK